MDWWDKNVYSFPPFICVPHALQKIWKDRALDCARLAELNLVLPILKYGY